MFCAGSASDRFAPVGADANSHMDKSDKICYNERKGAPRLRGAAFPKTYRSAGTGKTVCIGERIQQEGAAQ